jgi:hypothetical protein
VWGPMRAAIELLPSWWRRFFFRRQHLWCVRVNVSRAWDPSNPDRLNPANLLKAGSDLEPRPRDNGGLSVYAVSSEEEGRKAAVLHTVVGGKPKAFHFLLIPSACLSRQGIDIRREFLQNQHPYLRDRHHNVYGLAAPAVREEVVQAILKDPQHRFYSIGTADLRVLGKKVADDAGSIPYITYLPEWQKDAQKLKPKGGGAGT